jgi:hypothetical protein
VNPIVIKNVAIALLGIYLNVAVISTPHQEKEKEADVSGIPFVVVQGSQPSVRVRAQIVRVLDAATSIPIKDAMVTVRIRRRFAMDQMLQKEGRTNAQGVFVFTFEEANRRAQAFMSIDAPEYWGVDDQFRLAGERVITLFRLDGGNANPGKSAKELWMDGESCGRLLSWPL